MQACLHIVSPFGGLCSDGLLLPFDQSQEVPPVCVCVCLCEQELRGLYSKPGHIDGGLCPTNLCHGLWR